MAYERDVLCFSFEAGEDLSAAQYHFVKLTTTGTIEVCDAVTDKPIGVLQDNPPSGSPGSVMIFGISKIRVEEAATGQAVAVADSIGTGAKGRADKKVIGNTTHWVVGQALTLAASVASPRLVSIALNAATPHLGSAG